MGRYLLSVINKGDYLANDISLSAAAHNPIPTLRPRPLLPQKQQRTLTHLPHTQVDVKAQQKGK